MVEIQDGTANINMNMETSSNLSDWNVEDVITKQISIDPSLNNFSILSGTTSDSIRLPLGNYYYGGSGYQDFTFFFVARYSGTTTGRIFNDLENNWLTGFWGGRVGISSLGAGGWVGNLGATQTALLENNSSSDWWVGTTQRQKLRVNGNYVAIDLDDDLLQSPNRLAINIGQSNQTSEWNIAELLYFNSNLFNNCMLKKVSIKYKTAAKE